MVNVKFLLSIFILISLIGITDSVLLQTGCCEKTTKNAWCQDGPVDCASGYRTNSNICEETNFCQTGYCYDVSEGICESGSTSKRCDEKGGQFFRNYDEQLCQEGCCYRGKNTDYVTESRCNILAKRASFPDPVWDSSVSEEACRFLSEEEGACVIDERCIFTTEKECVEMFNGEINLGRFCSDLNNDYEKKDHKECYNGDVYWYDSGGNRENVAEDCVEGESICKLQGGDYTCKDITCFDEKNDKIRKHGESWCEYEGYIGESRSLVGSEQCKLACVNGEIEVECSDKRTKLCAENITNGKSNAVMRNNLAMDCFNIKYYDECNNHPDCKYTSFFTAGWFNVGMCVPKYPLGIDFKSENPKYNGENICALGNLRCWVAVKPGFPDPRDYNIGEWTANIECTGPEFIRDMNYLCTSIGDCGMEINYVGVKTTNYQTIDNMWQGVNYRVMEPYDEGFSGGLHEVCEDYVKRVLRGDEGGSWKEWYFWLCRQYLNANIGLPSTWDTGVPAYWNVSDFLKKENPQDVLPEYFLTNRNPSFLGTKYINVIYKPQEWDKILAIDFRCNPWQPPFGGRDCNKCNEGDIPCNDYRCNALGQTCKILDDTRYSENPICISEIPPEFRAPEITFKESPGYKGEEFVNGVKITNLDGSCIEKHSDISIVLETDERAKCAFVLNSSELLQALENEKRYNTTHQIDIRLSFDDRLRIYTSCQDVYGTRNTAEYVTDICISPEADNKEPGIERFEPEDGSFIPLEQTNLSLNIILKEPAECKYERFPFSSYDEMTGLMSCNKDQEGYVERFCLTTLEGLDQDENKIYIKCRDLAGNTNIEDKIYTVYATKEPLLIEAVSPLNGEILKRPVNRENPLDLEIKTSGGAYNGNAECGYVFVEQGWSDNDLPTETGTISHKYRFTNLEEGSYNVKVSCNDKAGNTAETIISFSIEVDETPPKVVRVFKDGSRLKIITDEEARCYYNNINACTPFELDERGTMTQGTSSFSKNHSANWDESKTYYIKCKDQFGNSNNGCAIIVKPS